MPQNDPISRSLEEHLHTVRSLEPLKPVIAELAQRIILCLKSGHKILWMGNGGSAADSQHLAAEIVGRFSRHRVGLPSIALTTDTSILTSVGNDFGYEQIFARQIEALCFPDDVVVGISTSGNSQNVVNALEVARNRRAHAVGLTGEGGGKLASLVDLLVAVPSRNTARIQECHILIGHLLCEYIDSEF